MGNDDYYCEEKEAWENEEEVYEWRWLLKCVRKRGAAEEMQRRRKQ